MSSTSKARLQALLTQMDALFGNAHPDDRIELVQELREYLSRQRSGAKQATYDAHANSATTSLS